MKNILVVRTDRLGDLVLVTPALGALRRRFPDARITALVHPYAAPLLENHPFVDEIIADKPFFRLLGDIRARNFDASIHFFVDARTPVAAWLAGVPLRIGPASKIWSLFLNRRITQNRSKILRHEADFNLDLLAPLGADAAGAKSLLVVTAEEKKAARRYLSEKFSIADGDALVIIHPGSKGSAKNWPPGKYAELADKILAESPGAKVLLTGACEELPLLRHIADRMPLKPAMLEEPVPLRLLMALLSLARAVVTNSTGPLHIAAALGVPTVSFFPKLKGCLPERWGPYGEGHIIFQPEGEVCPVCNPSCRRGDCMADIDTKKVLEAVRKQVEKPCTP